MINRKTQIRREVMERRAAMSTEERAKASMVLADRIMGHQWYYLSDTVLGFYPYGTEIDVRDILQDILDSGKKLYLPKVIGDEMQFFRVFSLEHLEEGYKGIREPKGNTEYYPYSDEVAGKTLLIMPGVAFDVKRNRIGYGKGYYDKYLHDKEALQVRSIAVGFECQQVPEIPAIETDIKPYQVILV